MSLASKLTLGGAFVFTCGVITFVHYKQDFDRKKMHEGVIKDEIRQKMFGNSELLYLNAENDKINEERVLRELVGAKEPR